MTATTRGALAFLAGLHLLVAAAGFLAPYDPAAQNRDRPFTPPTGLGFRNGEGGLQLRPLVGDAAPGPGAAGDGRRLFPLRFFVRSHGAEAGRPGRLHLFGVDEPGRVFLLGTDAYGRDVFSRLLFGGRVALLAGWLATGLALGVGALLGTVAGFYGRAVDALVMRIADLFLALPWLYLLLAVRAFLPLHLPPAQTFLLVSFVLAAVGWARPARLVRGVVLSAKERDFVQAARGFGAGDLHLLRWHVVPETYDVLLTQAALLLPHYVLAEVSLSFLGLGVSEPVPSWGNMLASLMQYRVLTSCWWMFAPGLVLVPLILSGSLVAEHLRARSGAAS